MVVPSISPVCNQTACRAVGIPVVDLSKPRADMSRLIVEACEVVGFFKVINHGVSKILIERMESIALEFFSLPSQEKEKAGPPAPLGYGVRNIGFNGDVGELEYLLLHANPSSISHKAKVISKEPSFFSYVVNEYVAAVRHLSCEILDMLAEGLKLRDTNAFSTLLRDFESDSLLRINHYPPWNKNNNITKNGNKCGGARIGFGEHSDPQIISVLRSNDVEGLQVLTSGPGGDHVWAPVAPDPDAFFINIGDLLQAMTNGRLLSVRHRAMANSYKERQSIIFFGAPPLHSLISPLPDTVSPANPCKYNPFTWSEYKKTMYQLRLSHNRLDLFRADEPLEIKALD
ncbi:gibberellin 2-beta-dioxygenase 2 [Carex littledalei]|uniref:gibberellin 2beta-dioxygenase n=1 Tax=Carex littledalei TaxID=544730 RepID=A0A833R5S7_9POAL|nr:gibberellin 2-beta-dioxygenase 2 [Carex littledalei]